MNNLWQIIFYLGLAQGIFLIVALLLLKKKRRMSVLLIVAILLCLLSLIVWQLLKDSLALEQILTMYRVGGTIPLLIGPLFLFYMMSLVQADFKITPSMLLHFAPFLIFLAYYSATTFGLFGEPLNLAVFGLFKGAHTLVYYTISWLYLRRISRNAKKGVKPWFNARLIANLVVLQIVAVLIIYTIVGIEALVPTLEIESDRISSAIITFFFFAFAFAIILYPNEMLPDKLLKTTYAYSSLRDSDKEAILKKVVQQLEDEKLFLDPELSLSDMSRKININSGHVSQVVNELLDKNFNQLINEYRIAEVQRNILDPKRTLLGIAFDSGFNSKSAFNRLFKEIVGQTPSEYKKKALKRS